VTGGEPHRRAAAARGHSIRLMPRRLAALLVLALSALGGAAACGAGEPPRPDPACIASPRAIERALTRAPAPVTLGSGTRLSDCIAKAQSDADLQNAGLVLTRVADDLSARAQRGDAQAALGLGYLVGAARRGAAHTNGIHAELQHRMESAARPLSEEASRSPTITRALARGLRAGEATG
jgi:hypothetical protein